MRNYFRNLNEFKYTGETKYFPGLNGVKGLLILVVVLTHCLPPSMILYFLYFFHMPLFMGISGFLLKQSAFKNGYWEYLKRVFHRLLIPWIIASVIFLPFRLTEAPVSPLSFYDIIYPYYHLWYIPSYMIGATICYCITKLKSPVWPTLLITLIITIIWYIIYRDPLLLANVKSIFLVRYSPEIYKHHVAVRDLPLYWLGEKRLYSYVFFFMVGFSLRNLLFHNKLKYPQSIILMFASFVALIFLIFGRYSNIISVWPYLIFNISLVIFTLIYVGPQNWFQNKYLLIVNELTLGIYLYHPLVQKIIFEMLGDRGQTHHNLLGGTGIFILVIAVTLGLLWIMRQWSVTDKYLLGNIKR